MKIIIGLTVTAAAIAIIGEACLFRNPTLFMYPIHASCNITWTFLQDCTTVKQKLMDQFETWKGNDTCGSGQTCMYSLGEVNGNEIAGSHVSTKIQSVDDMQFKLYRNSATGGCNVIGYSTSVAVFVYLDFGTNYCNLHNIVAGAGLTKDPNYSELTRDEMCTQYTSANCEKY